MHPTRVPTFLKKKKIKIYFNISNVNNQIALHVLQDFVTLHVFTLYLALFFCSFNGLNDACQLINCAKNKYVVNKRMKWENAEQKSHFNFVALKWPDFMALNVS